MNIPRDIAEDRNRGAASFDRDVQGAEINAEKSLDDLGSDSRSNSHSRRFGSPERQILLGDGRKGSW